MQTIECAEEKEMQTDAKVLVELLKFGPVVVGEFRGQTVDTINYVDKKTGQKAHFNQGMFRIELDRGAVPVLLSVAFEDGKESSLPQFKKGDIIAAVVGEFENARGVLRGRVEKNSAITKVG